MEGSGDRGDVSAGSAALRPPLHGEQKAVLFEESYPNVQYRPDCREQRLLPDGGEWK